MTSLNASFLLVNGRISAGTYTSRSYVGREAHLHGARQGGRAGGVHGADPGPRVRREGHRRLAANGQVCNICICYSISLRCGSGFCLGGCRPPMLRDCDDDTAVSA